MISNEFNPFAELHLQMPSGSDRTSSFVNGVLTNILMELLPKQEIAEHELIRKADIEFQYDEMIELNNTIK